MSFRVLLSPQLKQEWRHCGHDNPRAVYLCVTAWAERDHQIQYGFPRNPMVDDDGAFVPTGSVTHPATLPIALQNSLPQTAEVLLILPLECVTGRAKTHGKHLPITTRTVQRALY